MLSEPISHGFLLKDGYESLHFTESGPTLPTRLTTEKKELKKQSNNHEVIPNRSYNLILGILASLLYK